MKNKGKKKSRDTRFGVCLLQKNGLLERIRTSDTRLRRAVLCPAELQADIDDFGNYFSI